MSPELDDPERGLWTVAQPLTVMGAEIGSRMTVMCLADGGLLVHSPIELGLDVRRRIDTLGRVAHLLAPNADHYRFVPQWQAAYPAARSWAVAGVPEKLPAARFDVVLTPPQAPDAWMPIVEARYFRSSASFCELVLFHRASRTLVSSDLAFNIQRSEGLTSRLLLILNDSYRSFGPSRLCRRLIKDPATARRDLDAILAWEPERLVVAHGDVVHDDATAKLRQGYAWLRSE